MTNDDKLRELQQLKREKERGRLTDADYHALVETIRVGEDEYRAARDRIGPHSSPPPTPPAWAAKIIARLENSSAALQKKAQAEQERRAVARGRTITRREATIISILVLGGMAVLLWPDDQPPPDTMEERQAKEAAKRAAEAPLPSVPTPTRTSGASGTDALCAQFGNMAERTMWERQNGASMSEMMQASPGEMERAMIRDAYKQPAFSTATYQQLAVRNFRNAMESACYQAFAK